MSLFFVGGASGSGKTAMMCDLQIILGDVVTVYDFDAIGVPEAADKKWCQQSTELWLQRFLQKKQTVCLLGQIVLGEILACPSAKKLGQIHFCLLDVEDFERVQRLKKRNTYGIDQNMLNWASWLRMHHRDPQWIPQVIHEDSWDGLDFSVWAHQREWEPEATIKFLDTTELDVQSVAQEVARWITSSQ